MVVALVAILRAGGADVPLDAAYPQARLAQMCADASPRLVLTEPALGSKLPPETALSFIGDLRADAGDPFDPGTDRTTSHTSSTRRARPASRKAAAIAHASVSRLIDWAQTAYTADELAGVLAATSISFDLSVSKSS